MRIAFFSDTYHPSVDGVVRAVDLFARGLRSRGHMVKIFAPAPPGSHLEEKGVVYAPSVPFLPYPQYRSPLWLHGMLKEAAAWKPDIVHSHAMFAMGLAAREAAKKSGAPLVGTFHTQVPSAMHYLTKSEGLQQWGEHLGWRYLSWFYRPFDVLLAPSLYMQGKLQAHGLRSTLLASPVDDAHFKPKKTKQDAAMAAKWGLALQAPAARRGLPRAPMILHVGRVAQEKNIGYLLQMASTSEWKNWKARLLIAGEGPEKAELEAEARRRGLLPNTVRFLGRMTDVELSALYRAADLVALPSKFETQGLVALEAMACGTPVAAMEGTAMVEVVREKISGTLMRGDAQEDVKTMRRALARRAALSAGARKIAADYTVEKCTEKLLAVYKKVK